MPKFLIDLLSPLFLEISLKILSGAFRESFLELLPKILLDIFAGFLMDFLQGFLQQCIPVFNWSFSLFVQEFTSGISKRVPPVLFFLRFSRDFSWNWYPSSLKDLSRSNVSPVMFLEALHDAESLLWFLRSFCKFSGFFLLEFISFFFVGFNKPPGIFSAILWDNPARSCGMELWEKYFVKFWK